MQNQNSTAMTLRLTEDLADQLADVSHTLRMSKSAWVRKAIRRSIEYTRVHELPLLERRGIREALAR